MKFNSSFHPLPSIPSPLPEVGDQFGDHFERGQSHKKGGKPQQLAATLIRSQ
jgi:hypothetical protein